MNAFTIKDLENLSGIKAHTIRIWEQRYSFLKPRRSGTNIRYYCNDELKMVLNIALLNKYGYKISLIDKMSSEMIMEKVFALTQAEARQERIINELLHCMISLNMDNFEMQLDAYIEEKGIHHTITDLIFPFLHKIGVLWMTSHINIAQEHLVSNAIRQKLIMGIENCSLNSQRPILIALFLPEGEHHEMGLLYVHYMLKNHGIKVLYLGADVPMEDLEFIAKAKKPDYLYAHLTCIPGKFNFEKYLTQINSRIADSPIVISGQIAQRYYKKVPSGIIFKKTMHEVHDFISAL